METRNDETWGSAGRVEMGKRERERERAQCKGGGSEGEGADHLVQNSSSFLYCGKSRL